MANYHDYGRNTQSTNSSVRRFFICTEGEKTEIDYFKHLDFIIRNELEIKDVKLEPEASWYGPDPTKVLKTMKEKMQKTVTKSHDEVWLVVDRDEWRDEHYEELEKWEDPYLNFHWVISNPCFEFWLLLHFEDGNGIETKDDCIERLRNYIPNYKKAVNPKYFNLESVKNAVKNAQPSTFNENSYCKATPGSTTVHKLVARVLKLEEAT